MRRHVRGDEKVLNLPVQVQYLRSKGVLRETHHLRSRLQGRVYWGTPGERQEVVRGGRPVPTESPKRHREGGL